MYLSEICALPEPKAPVGKQWKMKKAINYKATCITDREVLLDLKAHAGKGKTCKRKRKTGT